MVLDLEKTRERPYLLAASLMAAFCIGVALGPLFTSFTHDKILLALVVWATLVFLAHDRDLRLLLILILLLIGGVFRYTQAVVPSHVSTVSDAAQTIRVTGVVDGEVERRIGFTRVVIDDVTLGERVAEGKVLVRLDEQAEVAYGDQLVFTCRLEEPEPIESFRYDAYLASRGIHALCHRPKFLEVSGGEPSIIGTILSIKNTVVSAVHRTVPEPHASFLSGLVFGGSAALGSELRDAFSRTGTSHILAASGFNVSLFTLVFFGWLRETRLGRKRALIVSAGLLFVFVIMAGATASVLRAALMASLILLANLSRRIAYLPNILLAALTLLLLINPLQLYADVGFQLSFVATIALLILPTYFDKPLSFLPKSYGLRESFVGSVSAIILTLPIILWHFGSVSIVAPIVNLLVLPLVIPAMALTAFAIVGSWLLPALGSIVGLPAWIFSSVMLQLIAAFASLPVLEPPVLVSRVLAVLVTAFFLLILWRSKRRAVVVN